MSSPSNIRIAVDAMGGDYAPGNTVAGALAASTESSDRLTVLLVGKEDVLRSEVKRQHGSDGRVEIVHASEVIDMSDSPNAALRAKRDSSIAVGLGMHKKGRADGFISAGNTGAVLSASTLILGRIKGVARPTIGALFPTESTPCFVVDAGTNVDCRPRHLFEFAVMGSEYVSALLDKKRPKIGLISIGEEDMKGNEVTQETLKMLRASNLNFVGNVEGRDILRGKVDVAVCDGFVGNVLLKFGESVPAFLKSKLTEFAGSGLVNRLKILLARGGLRAVMRNLDYQEYGGVPLLGVNGVSIIGHGGSTPKAIMNMILLAEEMVRWKINERIEQAIVEYN